MHGRILYYNDMTGTGTIANLHRRVFEFTKQSWHDRRSLPEREMFVDFRLDEHGKVTDCKESSFKQLKKSYPISENDFWATADDQKLEERSNEAKEALILQGIHTLDPAKPLPITLPMDRCFDLFFSEELEMLTRYEELFANESSYRFVDYAKLKPFLQKAKAHLLSLDPSIGYEPFLEAEQDIRKLEALLEGVDWVFRLESRALFEEMFLKHQIVYLQAKRRFSLELERASQLEARAKKIPFDLETLKKRATSVSDPKVRISYEEKMAHLVKESEACQRELVLRQKSAELLGAQMERFEKANFEELMEAYNFEEQKEKVRFYLRRILDYLGYVLDYTIWEHASTSKNIASSFYNQGIQGGFNAFSFLRYYLKPLDKSRLSLQDKELYRYLCEYEAKETIKFLVVSEDAEFAMMLKRRLLGAQKDVLVYAFSRGVDSMPYIKSVSVHAAFVDMEIRSIKIEEWLEFFEQHTPSPDAKIFCWVLGFGDAREESLKTHRCLTLKKSLGEEKLAKMLECLLPTLKKG